MISRRIETRRKPSKGSLESRKHLLEYDDVMNSSASGYGLRPAC